MTYAQKLRAYCRSLQALVSADARVLVVFNGENHVCEAIDNDDDLIFVLARNCVTSERVKFRMSEGYSHFTVQFV